MLRWLFLFIVIAAAAWWWGKPSPTAPFSSSAAATSSSAPTLSVIACTPPTRLAGDDGAVQSDAPGGMTPFALTNATAKPLAGFSVAARVLSREEYGSGREADFSPVDLALGWGPMRDDAVLSKLDISQSGRFYRYRWSDQPPIPPDDIVRSSANMHMVPFDANVARQLERVNDGDVVRIHGWLVHIDDASGWRWRSSLSREDSGAGACELVLVCSIGN